MQLVPVILAGGSGTRLWPRSRASFPKQFLDLTGSRSLLAETVARFANHNAFEAPIIAGAAEHDVMIARELQSLRPRAFIVEPLKRNTAPAIAAAAVIVTEMFGADAILCAVPADQIVRDCDAFAAALLRAAAAADGGSIVTIGIEPKDASSAYGYIERGVALPEFPGVYSVERFVEKPDRSTAEEFVASGNFLWNAGMFVMRADVLLSEFALLHPEILDAARKSVAHAQWKDTVLLDADAFTASPSISFDYAVMERTRRAAVVPAEFGWADVGNWLALWQAEDKDAQGNALRGDIIASDCNDCHIESDRGLLVARGLEGMAVVQTRDATLIAPLDRAQDLSAIVEKLSAEGRAETASHRKVQRFWGWYDALWDAPGYRVKHLMIAPGAAISLQMHRRRSEHWVVVSGEATITRGEEVFTLRAGQSTFIPVETRHRLENRGEDELHIVEVQLGDYLGEDDIVRFEDRYNRT